MNEVVSLTRIMLHRRIALAVMTSSSTLIHRSYVTLICLFVLSSVAFRAKMTSADSKAGSSFGRHGRHATSSTGNRETILQLFIPEEMLPNTAVGSVVRDYGLERRYPPDVIATLRFRILSHSSVLSGGTDNGDGGGGSKSAAADDRADGEGRWWFTVDEVEGLIRTGRRIDREELCPRLAECNIAFDVVVQPAQYFQIIKVRVEIFDNNDNAPFFPVSSKSIELSEAAELETSFLLPSADDLDSAKNGVARYEIRPPTPVFKLAGGGTGVDAVAGSGPSQLRLVLRQHVDREKNPEFRFAVVAIDAGDPVMSGTLIVVVTVTDVNDNSPQFATRYGAGDDIAMPVETRLPESAPIGSPVYRVTATDPDDGANGVVTYVLGADTERDYGRQFGVDRSTGQIYTRSTFDREQQELYLLYIVATDNASPVDRKSTQTSIIVRIDDVNDNAPNIRINGLTNAVPRPEIRNGSADGTFVAHLSVDDPDAGANGKFTCHVAGNELFELRQLYSTEFKVVVAPHARVVSTSPTDVFRFAIICRDSGIPEMTSSKPLEVVVVAPNDNAPLFRLAEYQFVVAENSPAGTTVGLVEATDPDPGPGGQVTYRIEPVSGSEIDRTCVRALGVNSENGLIVTSSEKLDRESNASCEAFVVAADRGNPIRSSQVRIVINVSDDDDEEVKFPSDRYWFVVSENQPAGTEVGLVTAVDADLPPYNEITYVFDSEQTVSETNSDASNAALAWNELNGGSGLPASSAFSIDPYTGHIVTLIPLDRETVSRYSLLVSASSTVHGFLTTATATVVIEVADLNDNAPVFQFPTESGIDGTELSVFADIGANNVPLLAGSDVPLATIKARDNDAGQNARIVYRISGSKPPSIGRRMFDLEPTSGRLTFSRKFDWSTAEARRLISGGSGEVELELTATDGQPGGDFVAAAASGHLTARQSAVGQLRVVFRHDVIDAATVAGGVGAGGGGALARRVEGVLVTALSSEHLAVFLACTLAVILVVISIAIATVCLLRSQIRRRRMTRRHADDNGAANADSNKFPFHGPDKQLDATSKINGEIRGFGKPNGSVASMSTNGFASLFEKPANRSESGCVTTPVSRPIVTFVKDLTSSPSHSTCGGGCDMSVGSAGQTTSLASIKATSAVSPGSNNSTNGADSGRGPSSEESQSQCGGGSLAMTSLQVSADRPLPSGTLNDVFQCELPQSVSSMASVKPRLEGVKSPPPLDVVQSPTPSDHPRSARHIEFVDQLPRLKTDAAQREPEMVCRDFGRRISGDDRTAANKFGVRTIPHGFVQQHQQRPQFQSALVTPFGTIAGSGRLQSSSSRRPRAYCSMTWRAGGPGHSTALRHGYTEQLPVSRPTLPLYPGNVNRHTPHALPPFRGRIADPGAVFHKPGCGCRLAKLSLVNDADPPLPCRGLIGRHSWSVTSLQDFENGNAELMMTSPSTTPGASSGALSPTAFRCNDRMVDMWSCRTPYQQPRHQLQPQHPTFH